MNAILTPIPAVSLGRAALSGDMHQAFDDAIRRDEDSLVLGRFWYALHFTLCGEVPFPSTVARRQNVEWPDDPLMDALMGGEDAGIPDDFGGGRLHRPPAVTRIARALREIPDEEVRERYDPDGLIDNEIPPAIWEDDPAAAEKIVAEFNRLVTFYARCESAGDGVLLRVVR